jgi:hypothetical protein
MIIFIYLIINHTTLEIIYKKIVLKENKDLFVNLLLTEKHTPIGVLDEIENTNPNVNEENKTILITGFTEDRLNEVKGYNTTTPYVVHVNGVTQITRNSNSIITDVYYIIDNIHYHTDIINNITTYAFSGTGGVGKGMNDNFLYKDDTLLGITERPDIKNYINIDRQEISIIEPQLLIQNVRNLEDIEDLINDLKI